MSIRRVVLLLLVPVAVGCGRTPAPPPASARSSAPVATATGVVAEGNGGAIQARERDERVYARRAGVTRVSSAEPLLKQEVDKKAALPDEAQLDTIYEQNKPRFGNAPKKEAVAPIREIRTQRAVGAQRADV